MNLRYSIYSDYSDIHNLEEIWGKIDNHFFDSDYSYSSALIREKLVDGDSVIVLFKDDSNNKNIIIKGIIKNVKYSPSIGYFTLKYIRFRKKCLYIPPYSILGDIEDDVTSCNIEKKLISFCRKNKIDYLNFGLLSKDSPFAIFLSRIRNPLKKDPVPSTEEHYILEVPDSLDDYLKMKDSKSRYNLKRVIKQIETEYNDSSIIIFTKPDEVNVFFEHAEIISQKSYLRSLNVGFKSTSEELKKKKILSDLGFFRSYILYLDGIPAAFINGILYKDRFFTEHIGFDFEYERFSVGSYLLLKTIEDIADSKCASIIDYSFGSDAYKKRFSSSCKEEIRVRLFVPKFSNLLFMFNLLFFTKATDIIRKVLKRTGAYNRIRKLVRNKLISDKN